MSRADDMGVPVSKVPQAVEFFQKTAEKYNVTIASIKKLNPSIGANNMVRVGQKLKLPAGIEVGEEE